MSTSPPSPGSAPDKAVLTTTIDEKATGELTFGGGYSTDAGALLDVGLSERNLVGTGINAGINGVLAQRRSSITASVTDPVFPRPQPGRRRRHVPDPDQLSRHRAV